MHAWFAKQLGPHFTSTQAHIMEESSRILVFATVPTVWRFQGLDERGAKEQAARSGSLHVKLGEF